MLERGGRTRRSCWISYAICGVACLVDHDNGVPRAMAKASKKEGEGKHTSNINAFTENIAADSDKAFEMVTRRF